MEQLRKLAFNTLDPKAQRTLEHSLHPRAIVVGGLAHGGSKDEQDLYVGNPADETLLLKYLHFAEYDAEKAFEKMKTVFGLKAENSAFYAYKRDPDLHDVILKKRITQILDYRDQLGRRIYVVKAKNIVVGEFEPAEMSQVDDLWLTLAIDERETQLKGVVFLFDLAGLPWSFVRYLIPSIIRPCTAKAENIPVRNVQYHVINGGILLNTLLSLVFPFLSQATKEAVFFHKNNESLHKHISPKCLPAEYGGERPAIDCEQLIHDFIDSRETRLKELLSYGYPPRRKD